MRDNDFANRRCLSGIMTTIGGYMTGNRLDGDAMAPDLSDTALGAYRQVHRARSPARSNAVSNAATKPP